MTTWCRYCHEEGHTKFECSKALARIICYNCDNAGHRQYTCPKPKKGSLAEKQNGSTDQTNTQAVKPMPEDEDTDDDDYMPTASESESKAEQMSDIEATEDEVANLQRERGCNEIAIQKRA